MTLKSHTFKVGDRVVETFDGVEIDCEIHDIQFGGHCTLINEEGKPWQSNIVWLTPIEDTEKLG